MIVICSGDESISWKLNAFVATKKKQVKMAGATLLALIVFVMLCGQSALGAPHPQLAGRKQLQILSPE